MGNGGNVGQVHPSTQQFNKYVYMHIYCTNMYLCMTHTHTDILTYDIHLGEHKWDRFWYHDRSVWPGRSALDFQEAAGAPTQSHRVAAP